MPRHINLAEAQGVLVAGRCIDTELTNAQVVALMELVDKLDKKFGDAPKVRLAAVPSGDFANATGRDEAHTGVVLVGHRSVRGCANDETAIGPYPVEELRGVVERANDIPDDFWHAVAGVLEASDAEEFMSQPVRMWLIATGPLAMGILAYGVRLEHDEASRMGLELVRGKTQGHVYPYRPFEDDDDDDNDDDENWEDGPLVPESQVPHSDGVAGWSVSVDDHCEAIDLSEAAHAERVEQTRALPGDKAYFVIGQFD